MVLCATVSVPVEAFFLRYTEHITPTVKTDIPEVPEVLTCKCDGTLPDHLKTMKHSDSVTTTAPSRKFPLAVPMFSSYGWGPQG